MGVELEQRVANLEKEMTELKKSVQIGSIDKVWRKTFGMSKNDAGFDEMVRLGQEIRHQERENGA